MVKLKDVHFSDIIFNNNGTVLIRNLQGMPRTLGLMPRELLEDTKALFMAMKKAEQDLPEFFVIYDTVPYRVAKMITLEGKTYAMRRPFYPVPELNLLGYPKNLIKTLKTLVKLKTGGLFMLAGATSSGKTTAIYSLLQYAIKSTGDILVALEDPPEVPMQGIYNDDSSGMWYQIDVHKYGGYEAALKATMRYNPRYILLGEIRDPSVAHWALRAAVNGHIVMTTIHGSSVAGALLSLLQTASSYSSSDLARSILADGLSGIMFQRLKKVKGLIRPAFEIFFPGVNMGVRSKIRSGKFEMLGTEIEMQNSAIQKGESLEWLFDPSHPKNQ